MWLIWESSCMAGRPELEPQVIHRKPRMMVHICDLSAGKVERDGKLFHSETVLVKTKK